MIIDSLLSLLAPHECLGCTAEGALLCLSCHSKLRPARLKCYKCQAISAGFATCRPCCQVAELKNPAQPLALRSVQAAVLYKGVAKDILWKLKFGRARSASTEVASLIAARLNMQALLAGRSPEQLSRIIVTHAPTANTRARQRGYDQSALIARRLAKDCNLPYAPLLRRLGHQKQMGANRAQRAAQLTGAYYAVRPGTVQGAHVLLVDDVVTTGATLEAAAQALMAAGARRVDGIVFAQA